MPAHRTQNSRHLRVEANPTVGAPQLNIISPTPQTFVFSSIPEASTSHPLPNVEASRSLPDLSYYTSTFHARSEDYSYSPTSSYNSPVSGASVSSFFASPSSSIYTGSSPGTPSSSYSPSPSPSNENGDFRRPRSSSTASIAPYPLPSHEFETKSNGQQRTQPPRPPNPWICFRNYRTQQYKEQQKYPEFLKGMKVRSAPTSPAQGILGLDGETGRRPRQADLSKIIADEWKALSDAERAPFIRMSEEEKIKHARKYPNYKYQPRRKTDNKKSKDRSESVGKSPSKRARSSSRATRAASLANEDEELCEITVPIPPHQPQMSVDQTQHAGFDTAMAHMSMHDLSLSVGQNNDSDETIYAGGTAGDPEKDWTCLPEQTLLPFSWDSSDQVGDAPVLGDVLNPGMSHSGEHEKDEEEDFTKPLFLWFPQAGNNNSQQGNTSFTAEPECESAPAQPVAERASDNNAFVNFSGVPSNFNFQEASSLGFHFDGFDFNPSMDDMDAPELRRDSVSSVGSYDLPGSNEIYSTLMDGLSAFGFGPNDMMDTSSFQSYTPEQSTSQPTNRSNTPSLRIDTTNIPGFRIPPSPRRASISSETVYKSADGMLCPPNMAQRPSMTHRRSKTLSVSPSFFLNQANDTPASTSTPTPSTTASELRSIVTPNAFHNECSTSVLVPKVMDPNFEKDLAAYSQTLSSISASDSFSKAMPVKRRMTPLPVSKNQNLEEGEFDDLNAEFDFEAEFGDMICLDGIRAPPSST